MAEARAEARDSFGIDTVFVEKFLPSPKHVEVQILADRLGSVTHLPERDCTIQQKHQKIVEIAPAVSVPNVTRHNMRAAAVRLATHVKYEKAATLEFTQPVRVASFNFFETRQSLLAQSFALSGAQGFRRESPLAQACPSHRFFLA